MKPLSEQIKEIEPTKYYAMDAKTYVIHKEDYETLRALAVLLSEACENVEQSDLCYGESKEKTIEALAKAAKMLEGRE